MDYKVINDVIRQIINIVNYYNRDNRYSLEVAEMLVTTLLGYFLVFGPEIFSKIDILLDSLVIHYCENDEEYFEELNKVNENAEKYDANPMMLNQYKFDSNGKVLGGIPNIIMTRMEPFRVVLNLAHEFSHALEGVSAKVIREDSESFTYKQGFATVTMEKETGLEKIENGAFAEFITVCIENRIARALVSLDLEQIDYEFIKKYLSGAGELQRKNFVMDSYSLLAGICKDLIDNDVFFGLIMKYYYDNETDLFEEEFDSYSSEVKLRILMKLMRGLKTEEAFNTMQNAENLKRKIAIFNKATNFEPASSLVFVAY